MKSPLTVHLGGHAGKRAGGAESAARAGSAAVCVTQGTTVIVPRMVAAWPGKVHRYG